MDLELKQKIKDLLLVGRIPSQEDLVVFWNYLFDDKIEAEPDFIRIAEDTTSSSLEDLENKLQILHETREKTLKAICCLKEIQAFLPSKIGFSLIRAGDKLNLALVYLDEWQAKLNYQKFTHLDKNV